MMWTASLKKFGSSLLLIEEALNTEYESTSSLVASKIDYRKFIFLIKFLYKYV